MKGIDVEHPQQQEYRTQAFYLFLDYSASNEKRRVSAGDTIRTIMSTGHVSRDQIMEFLAKGTMGLATLDMEMTDENFRNLSLGEMCAVIVKMYKLELE